MSAPLSFFCCVAAVAALAAAFAAPGRAQDPPEKSLAEIAAEAKRKKQESTRPVLTNDDLRVAAVAGGTPPVAAQDPSQPAASLAPYLPTPMRVVEAMLELARVREGDVVFDLGSGDGRIVIAAAELFGARGVGIEFDEELVERSRRTVAEKKLGDKVQFIHADALTVDLSPADVVTVYLTTNGLHLLRPNLESMLRRGTRVVAHDFAIPEWTPDEEREVMGRTLYLYLIR